jgi:hypothetical protein
MLASVELPRSSSDLRLHFNIEIRKRFRKLIPGKVKSFDLPSISKTQSSRSILIIQPEKNERFYGY